MAKRRGLKIGPLVIVSKKGFKNLLDDRDFYKQMFETSERVGTSILKRAIEIAELIPAIRQEMLLNIREQLTK